MFKVVPLVLLLASMPMLSQAQTLQVSGIGEVRATPDMATLSIGAEAEAETADEALRETSARTRGILATLDGAGIEKGDIQTSGVSVRPVWSRSSIDEPRRREITGFAASNDVRVTIRDLTQLGNVIAVAVSDGANSLGGVSFGLQDRQDLEDEARKMAVQDAMRKGTVLAEAADVTIEGIQSIREGGTTPGPMPVMRMQAEAMDAVPIAAGELTVSARVEITFDLSE